MFTRVCKGEFGNWMEKYMTARNMSFGKIAMGLRISRQSVSGHAGHLNKPPFPMVCAYCYILRSEETPEEVWEMVLRDWA